MALRTLGIAGHAPLLANILVRGSLLLLIIVVVVLGLFFAGIVLLTAMRARRRRAERAQRRLDAVSGPDPWRESATRLDASRHTRRP